MTGTRARYVGGTRFLSSGPGFYVSECGLFLISLLFQLDAPLPKAGWDGAGSLLDWGPTFEDIRCHYTTTHLQRQNGPADNVPWRNRGRKVVRRGA